jgi:hypothetical protein
MIEPVVHPKLIAPAAVARAASNRASGDCGRRPASKLHQSPHGTWAPDLDPAQITPADGQSADSRPLAGT